MPTFPDDTIKGVLAHMNNEHLDDNDLIARAFGDPDARDATMLTLDNDGATWEYSVESGTRELTIPWSERIDERPQIRAEIVRLYDLACTRLGVEPRPH